MKQTVRICRLVIPYFVNLDFPQQQTQDKTTKVEKQINLERSVRDVTSQPKDDVIKINDVTSQSKVDDVMDIDDVMEIDDGDSSQCENDILDNIKGQSTEPKLDPTTEAPSSLEMCRTQLNKMIHSIEENNSGQFSHFQECYKSLHPLRKMMLSRIKGMAKIM